MGGFIDTCCFLYLQPNDLQLLQQLGMSEEDQLKLALELSIQGIMLHVQCHVDCVFIHNG